MLAETFLYLFEADTKALQKGEKDAKKTDEDLQKSLKQTDTVAADLGGSFTDMLAMAGGALTAILSMGAMVQGISEASEYADTLGKLSRRLGENANDMSAWQEVVAKSGGSVSGFQGTISKLNDNFNEFATTGNTSILPFMQRLGINMLDAEGKAKSVMDVLPELASQFEGLSASESAGMGAKLGLDEGTILLLQQGREEVERQIGAQKKLFSITDKQIAVFESFNDAVSDTQTAFRGVFVELGADVLPIFEYFLGKVQDLTVWIKENKTFITGVFIALGTAIMAFAVPAMWSMAVASIAAFAPFYAIGAVVAALVLTFALLYDDIMGFLNGSSSAFEDMLKWLGMTGEEIEGMREAFRALGDAISTIIDVAVMGFKFFFGIMFDGAKMIYKAFEPLLKFFGGFLVDAIKTAIAWIQKAAEWAKDIADFFGFGDDKKEVVITENVNATQRVEKEDEEQRVRAMRTIEQANANPINNMTGGVMQSMRETSNSNSVSVDRIEINTQATNADEISREIGVSLEKQLKNTTANYEDGIDG